MVRQASKKLKEDLRAELALRGASLEAILDSCEDVVVFGSRATNPRLNSDWDVVCIGNGNLPRLHDFDFVSVSRKSRKWDAFLRSELAHHVAAYGKWIKGTGKWSHELKTLEDAIPQKSGKLRVRLRALQNVWPVLNAGFRQKWARLIRRDLQRLVLLHQNQATPPSRELDAEYLMHSDRLDRLLVDLKRFGEHQIVKLVRDAPCILSTLESPVDLNPNTHD